jgi:hypothetical protein
LLVFTSWRTKLFDSGSEFYIRTYTVGAIMDNIPVLEEKTKIKMPMKELGRQKPQNNMKCD